eukprot:m.31989 g.31989  ORF g.31989 m.31989 type:complete len:256 (-) comp12386_c0_seq2:1260-2027(-)
MPLHGAVYQEVQHVTGLFQRGEVATLKHHTVAMKTVPVFTVDAFTSVAFSGNPCAVVLAAEELDVALMQSIAAEMNLSETAFVTPRPGAPADPFTNVSCLLIHAPHATCQMSPLCVPVGTVPPVLPGASVVSPLGSEPRLGLVRTTIHSTHSHMSCHANDQPTQQSDYFMRLWNSHPTCGHPYGHVRAAGARVRPPVVHADVRGPAVWPRHHGGGGSSGEHQRQPSAHVPHRIGRARGAVHRWCDCDGPPAQRPG